ncbi:hypothetical protein I3760_02G187700 [Carya illinoinensis]|nr:hypothetical protein I3760_02G187700 [Carya illinoinensis]
MSTASTTLASTAATRSSSSSASTSITMRQAMDATSRVLCSWIWNRGPWILSDLVCSARSLGPIIWYLGSLEPATTEPRATTPRALSSSTPSSMLSGRRPKTAFTDLPGFIVKVLFIGFWLLPSKSSFRE